MRSITHCGEASLYCAIADCASLGRLDHGLTSNLGAKLCGRAGCARAERREYLGAYSPYHFFAHGNRRQRHVQREIVDQRTLQASANGVHCLPCVAGQQAVRCAFVKPSQQILYLLDAVIFTARCGPATDGCQDGRVRRSPVVQHVPLQSLDVAAVLAAGGVEDVLEELREFRVGSYLPPVRVCEQATGVSDGALGFVELASDAKKGAHVICHGTVLQFP